MLKDSEYIMHSSHRERTEEEKGVVNTAKPLDATARMEITTLPHEERKKFMTDHYRKYHTQWHGVVHTPRSHAVLLNITQRLSRMEPDARKAVLAKKRDLVSKKRDEEKTERGVKHQKTKGLAAYIKEQAAQKAKL